MILMAVGDEAMVNFVERKAMVQDVQIGIGREIDQKLVVDDRLTAGTNIFAAQLSGLLAVIAIAKERRSAFCRRSS